MQSRPDQRRTHGVAMRARTRAANVFAHVIDRVDIPLVRATGQPPPEMHADPRSRGHPPLVVTQTLALEINLARAAAAGRLLLLGPGRCGPTRSELLNTPH